jgi:ABC-2 type transport system ATP-binding protein
MIAVANLTKRFGRILALDGLSFELPKGAIAGLVGNNGAGKTTTLRILAGMAAPSAGTAWIGGQDIMENALSVRRLVGYLSENVPLYNDMRVGEFLRFRAGLKGVAVLKRRERVRQIIRMCSLQGVERKRIGVLSKGYRKRVALAEALVHLPPVLLLDDPLLGIDADHRREIQRTLTGLAGQHTILFTTHSMADIEVLGGRPLVLERGRLLPAGVTDLAPGSVEELQEAEK